MSLTVLLKSIRSTWRRELLAYFSTPLAYVFISVFLLLVSVFTWDISRFFDTGAADLSPFFFWHPWLFVLFMPALAMRLWADETNAGTSELILSLPISIPGLVFGKLLAAWTVAGLALILTFPWWIAVNILGPADNAVIALSYGMSFLMAGGYLALGSAVSALTRSAVLAFVLGVVLAFLMTIMGWPVITASLGNLLSVGIAEIFAQMSFLTHFETAQRGVLDLRAVLFFCFFIGFSMALNALFVSHKRSGAR